MNIIAKKYFYSENKAFWEAKRKEYSERLDMQSKVLQELPEEEQKKGLEELDAKTAQLLSPLLPLPDKICTIIDPLKYDTFRMLVDESIAFAEERIANLRVFTADCTGCICFAGEEITCFAEQMDIFRKLNAAADEVHIAPSVNTGEKSPLDIEGGVRLEFWFDFFHQVVLE